MCVCVCDLGHLQSQVAPGVKFKTRLSSSPTVFYCRGSQSVALRPAVSALPGNVLRHAGPLGMIKESDAEIKEAHPRCHQGSDAAERLNCSHRDDRSKRSKSGRERQIPDDITCVWNLKYDTVYETETDSHAEQNCGCPVGEQGRGGMDWEAGISRCELLYTVWMNNKVLLHSKSDSTQYPLTSHDGKRI